MNEAARSNEGYIVLSFGQSNEGCSAMDWAHGSYPVYPLPEGWDEENPLIKVAVDFPRPPRPFVAFPPHTDPPRWENIDGSSWTGYGFSSYGWEQSFMRELQERVNSTVYFVRIAKGGIPMSDYEPGGDMYPHIDPMITFAIDDIIAQGKTPVILFAHWGHGESNAGDAPSAYAARVNNFITFLRGVYPPYTNNIPFIMRKISHYQTMALPTNVNAAFDLVESGTANCYALDPDDMDPIPEFYEEPGAGAGNTIHKDGPTQIRYGVPFLWGFCLANEIIT